MRAWTLLVTVALASGEAYGGGAVEVDRIVAVVHDHAITRHALEKRINLLHGRSPKLDPGALRKQALDELIDEHLIRLECEHRDIHVESSEIEETIAGVLAANHLSPEELEKTWREQGFTEESYRELITNELLLLKLSHSMPSSVAGNQTDEEIQRDRARLRARLRSVTSIELRP